MTTEPVTIQTPPVSPMEELLAREDAVRFPQVSDMIEGTVLSVSRNEVHVDIDGLTTGVVRGREVIDESGEFSDLKVGDTILATVVDLENEKGELELSFRLAGHKRAWDNLENLMQVGTVIQARIVEANRGGLMVRVGKVEGFLPVSQLTVEHYPRVEGGEKDKILERLKAYVGETFDVKVIDVDEADSKLIVSEKAAYAELQHKKLEKYPVGTIVEGKVTGVVDFGAFVEFDNGLEGLVHISELAWQRIDNPRDFVKVGDAVKAKIIGIDDTKISLSMKRLVDDPWKSVTEKFHTGDVVEGTVLKLNPFGVFVELDKDIHGLAHISELSTAMVKHPSDVVKVGDVLKFKILSIEPENHRLGLSLKALQPGGETPAGPETPEEAPKEQPTETPEEAPADVETEKPSNDD